MDEVFGEEGFINEIIWHYNKFAGKATGFHSNHDVIFSIQIQTHRNSIKFEFQLISKESKLQEFGILT